MSEQAERFEQSLLRLEEIVKKLESGDVGLDASVELYREGRRLAGTCETLLSEAEQAIARAIEGDVSVG